MKPFAISPKFTPVLLVSNTLKKQNSLFLYSNVYFITVPLNFLSFYTKLKTVTHLSIKNYNIPSLTTLVVSSNLTGLFFLKSLKFVFSGKGHKLTFNKKFTITFNFGHSHIYYLYNYNAKPLLTLKTKGFFLGINSFFLKNSARNLKNSKSINTFTGKGVRFTKQIIRKKTGKVSMYM